MNEIKTSWATETPLYGSFDDYVIIESIEKNERILMRSEEFDCLISKLFDNWIKRKSKYIQILREWNTCSGFNDTHEIPSTILDKSDTISAIRLIEGVDNVEGFDNIGLDTLAQKDLKLLLVFLIEHEKSTLKIWQE